MQADIELFDLTEAELQEGLQAIFGPVLHECQCEKVNDMDLVETLISHYCVPGNHFVETDYQCANCGDRLCKDHQGNPEAPLGDKVACTRPACIEMVAVMNQD